MIVWNSQAQYVLKTYLQAFREWKHLTPFLIVQWPGKAWKMNVLQTLLKEYLGEFRSSDSKVLYNLSAILWKTHSFKVEVSLSDQRITDKETGTIFENLGSRDLRWRLARAPLWDIKVLVIEDIDRMTVSAANALLKEFEEPLPWRLIIWTSDQSKDLLDTILSRAFLVNFHRVSNSELSTMIPQKYSAQEKKLLLLLSRWAPWRLQSLLNESLKVEKLQMIYQLTKRYLTEGGSIIDQMSRIKERDALWRTYDELLSMIIWDPEISNDTKYITWRKMLTSNVNQENIMRSMMMRE